MAPTRAALIAIACLVTGCGTLVTYTPLQGNATAAPPRPAESVDVFLSQPPNRPYRDVGLLEAKPSTDLEFIGTDEMIAELRKQAGSYGCDAIFVKNIAAEAGSLSFGVKDVKTITATCICYTRTETAMSQPPR